MRERIFLICVAVLLGGVIGWNLNRPAPLPTIHIQEAKARAAKADTVLAIDTVYYAEIKPVYDTLYIPDSIPYWDTVWVKEYVKVADSTIRSCDKALRSCLTSLALRDTVIVYQDRYIKEIPKPSKLRDFIIGLAGFSLGYALHRGL